MAYIPGTTVKPQLAAPNAFTNPYDGKVTAKMNEAFDEAAKLINQQITQRDTEQAALQKIRTEQFNLDFDPYLKQLNQEYAALVSSGQASMDPQSHNKFIAEHFNEFAKNYSWNLSKQERADFELGIHKKIRNSYTDFVSTDLSVVGKEQGSQMLGNLSNQLVEQAADPSASPEELIVKLQTPAAKQVLENVYGKDNAADAVKAVASQIYEASTKAKANLYFQNNDMTQLEQLSKGIEKNTFYSAEQKQQLTAQVTLAKERVKGKEVAVFYVNKYQNKDGSIDLDSIKAQLDKHSDLTEEEKTEAQLQVNRQAKEVERQYQELRTASVNEVLQAGDRSNIPLPQWDQLRDSDKALLNSYKETIATDTTVYNQLLTRVMNMESIDIAKEGLNKLTINDLKELQALQDNLKGNPALQKQATAITKLTASEFVRHGVTDKQQQLDLYSLIVEEIRGRERAGGKQLSSMEILELINQFLSMQSGNS